MGSENSMPAVEDSKTKNFDGYFEVSLSELQLLLNELENAKRDGVRLEQLVGVGECR